VGGFKSLGRVSAPSADETKCTKPAGVWGETPKPYDTAYSITEQLARRAMRRATIVTHRGFRQPETSGGSHPPGVIDCWQAKLLPSSQPISCRALFVPNASELPFRASDRRMFHCQIQTMTMSILLLRYIYRF